MSDCVSLSRLFLSLLNCIALTQVSDSLHYLLTTKNKMSAEAARDEKAKKHKSEQAAEEAKRGQVECLKLHKREFYSDIL